jgi:hypothetical protein
MKTGIEVYFTEVNRPWSNEKSGLPHWVNVYSPDGDEVIGVPVVKGYVSIDLPPGRYLVTGTTVGIYRNFDSNETIVNVGCCDRVCVTIIPKSLHYCVWWTNEALKIIEQNPEFAPKVVEFLPQAIEILTMIEKEIPEEFRQSSLTTNSLDVVKKAKQIKHKKQ